VPVGFDRDNVPPAYLRQLRTEALNALHSQISPKDVNETWVRDAVSSKDVTQEAFKAVLDQRFGENRIMADPTDTEATRRAIAAGYTPVYGNQLTQGERDNIRTFREHGWDPVVPAGQSAFATKKWFTPGGRPSKVIEPENYTFRQKKVVEYAQAVAHATLGKSIDVMILCEPTLGFSGMYRPSAKGLGDLPELDALFAALFAGRPLLTLNLGRLGKAWFEATSVDGLERINWLLIHEFGHDNGLDHLSDEFHDGLCNVGSKLATAILTGQIDPTRFGFADHRFVPPR
jgi:hypothetical protein